MKMEQKGLSTAAIVGVVLTVVILVVALPVAILLKPAPGGPTTTTIPTSTTTIQTTTTTAHTETTSPTTTHNQTPWSYKIGGAIVPYFSSAAISSDGSYIVGGSSGFNGEVYLFNSSDNTPLWEYTTDVSISSVAISSNGTVVVGIYGEIYLFSKGNNTPLWIYQTEKEINSVSISADGNLIAVGSDKIYLFNSSSESPVWTYQISSPIVDLSSDGNYMIATSGEVMYLFGGVSNGSPQPLWTYQAEREGAGMTAAYVSRSKIASDSSYIAAESGCSGFYSKLNLFSRESNTPIWSQYIYQFGSSGTLGSSATSIAISSNGNYVALGTMDAKVYLFGRDNNTPLWDYWTRYMVGSVAVSSNGLVAATVSGGHEINLLDNSGAVVWSHEVDDGISEVVFSSDGRCLLVKGYNTLYFFDITQFI